MILIATDKFKGSLTAAQAAQAIAEGLRRAGINDEIEICPMADGGEGTPSTLMGHPVVATCDLIGWSDLALARRPILDRSSYALGKYLAQAYGPSGHASPAVRPVADKGVPVWVAIGGTITSDGGAGMLQALGMRFFDSSGNEITVPVTPRMLPGLSRVEISKGVRTFWRERLRALSDVEATLTGPGLSALDFAAQKGAFPEETVKIRHGLERFAILAAPGASSPFDGAGGGIGFAIATVLGSPAASGARTVLESKHIDWNKISLVITGEGKIDRQTCGGKVVDAIRREAARHNVRCLAVGGYVIPELRSREVVSTIDSPEQYEPAQSAQRLSECIAAYFGC